MHAAFIRRIRIVGGSLEATTCGEGKPWNCVRLQRRVACLHVYREKLVICQSKHRLPSVSVVVPCTLSRRFSQQLSRDGSPRRQFRPRAYRLSQPVGRLREFDPGIRVRPCGNAKPYIRRDKRRNACRSGGFPVDRLSSLSIRPANRRKPSPKDAVDSSPSRAPLCMWHKAYSRHGNGSLCE